MPVCIERDALLQAFVATVAVYYPTVEFEGGESPRSISDCINRVQPATSAGEKQLDSTARNEIREKSLAAAKQRKDRRSVSAKRA